MAKHTVFDPERDDPFILSRTAIDEFLKWQKCFYFKRRLGLKPPRLIPLTLAIATDAILKIMHLQFKVPGRQPCYRRAISSVIPLSGITMTKNACDKQLLSGNCFVGRFFATGSP